MKAGLAKELDKQTYISLAVVLVLSANANTKTECSRLDLRVFGCQYK